jgi:murein DD-endopeptidase MepM/ murein hydrolase activator NlpD
MGAVAGNVAPVTPGTSPGTDAERQRVKQLAQEFEALLMTQMLREMRRSMLSEDESKTGFGNETMTDTIDIELGRALSRAGGFGLSGVLFKAIDRSLGAGALRPSPRVVPADASPVPAVPTRATPVSAAPAGESESAPADDGSELKVPDGRVSSAFGWRHDPFTGIPQFHRGIDVAHAYGQDVRAAAAGRIAFAGNQGAYGRVIVIEHPGGRQTRYAHLSAAGVQAGDLVEAGQVIGQSGDSGRSTGPHLHFEVLEAGQAVDPVAGS